MVHNQDFEDLHRIQNQDNESRECMDFGECVISQPEKGAIQSPQPEPKRVPDAQTTRTLQCQYRSRHLGIPSLFYESVVMDSARTIALCVDPQNADQRQCRWRYSVHGLPA